MIDADKKLWRMVRAALRKCWMWYSPGRKEAFEAARLNKSEYRCAQCEKAFARSGVRCDHVKPCGSLQGIKDLPVFAERLFYGKLQILCEADHAKKTALEAAARRKK